MQALEPEGLLPALDAVARRHFTETERSEGAVVAAVRALSQAYTRRGAALPSLRGDRSALHARLRFFLPRDLPKIWGPLFELVRVDALPPLDPAQPALRILDLGSGLGTTSLGVALQLARGPRARALEITAVDADGAALSLMQDVFGACEGMFDQPVGLRVQKGGVTAPPPGRYDLIVAGLVLNEAVEGDAAGGTRDGGPDAATAAGRRLVERWAQALQPGGAMIVLEPALREQTRRLQAIRELLREQAQGPHVFAPCTHRGSCPLLTRERDWCHERMPWTLAPELQRIASAAGLRWQGLSYSYLTLHSRDRSLAELSEYPLLRGTSAALRSKGKTEVQLCGQDGEHRLMQLDRKRKGAAVDIGTLGRGTLVSIDWPEAPAEAATSQTQPLPRQLRSDRAAALRVHQAWSVPASMVDPEQPPQ